MEIHLTAFKILLLSGASTVAAIIDTLAGGGGLITLPILLILGMLPSNAIATSKFQACFGELNASIHFMRHGGIDFRELLLGSAFTVIGSILGSLLVQKVHPDFLNKVIPFLLLIVLIYSIFAGKFVKENAKPKLSLFSFYVLFGLLIGFYGGFFGPGTGSFWVIALMFFLGFDIKKATLYTKPYNFVGDFISLFCFMLAGVINYKVGIVMAVGQVVGSHIGAKLVIYKGAKIIRPLFVFMVAIMVIVMFYRFII